MRPTSVRTLLHSTEPEGSARGVKQWTRVVLDTSQVNKGMLHVNDPVNNGISSEIDVALEWLDLVPPRASGPVQLPPSSSSSSSAAGDAPLGLLLVELHGGVGFPEEPSLDVKKGLRWQCQLENDQQPRGSTPAKSQMGKPHSEEPEFSLPLHPSLFPII